MAKPSLYLAPCPHCFNIFKNEITSVQDYYRLSPSISYETLLEGVAVKTSKGNIALTKKEPIDPKKVEKLRRKAAGKRSD